MSKNEKIRNLKAFMRGYVNSDHGKKTLNRPTGHIATGKTYKDTFYKMKPNGHTVVETKDVRVTEWRNNALAKALVEALA